MRIDAHCHVFTFETLLTQAAADNLKARIKGRFLSEAVANDALRLVYAVLAGDDAAGRLLEFASRHGVVGQGFLEFLRRGCLPDISAVTDALFAAIAACPGADAQTLVVPLLLDVVTADSPEAELAKYDRQYAQTVLQAVRRPGRVLPFVAVNPLRPRGALERLERALESGGCVGVKLYPSLGFAANHPLVDRIMDACQRYDAPVTMHCNDGGFHGPGQYDDTLCSPVDWRSVIEAFDVRCNFAHFGDQTPGNPHSPAAPFWRDQIVGMMEDGDLGQRVFADVSYQQGAIGRPEERAAYAAWLRGRMADGLGDNILFGTDSFMVLPDASEADFWRFFEATLGPDGFARIACDNPRRFLGLPDAGQAPKPGSAMERHIAFLRRGKAAGGNLFAEKAPPADWLAGRL
uniref:Putative TIM-barrel fold metal-dependent hydrolase n=1 Tax=Desulfovibrio sp. U5L TaxID=596152 RepID=I2PWT5_9BACT